MIEREWTVPEGRVLRKGVVKQPDRAGFILLLVYMCVEYVRPQDYVSVVGVIKPGLVTAIALLLLWAFKSDKQELQHALVRLYIAFVALAAIAVVHATNTYWAAQITSQLAVYLVAVILPVAFFARDLARFTRLIDVWIGMNVITGVYAIFNGGMGPGSFLGDENDLALAMAMVLPYAYFLAKRKGISSRRRWWYWVAMMVFVAAIIASMSRGGFVGLMVTALLMVMLSQQKWRNLAVVVGIAILAYWVVPQEYREEIGTITDSEDETRQQRTFLWERGWDMYLDNPVLGVGPGNFPWNVREYILAQEEVLRGVWAGRAAHSLYFTLIPEMGTVGIGLFIAMCVVMWRRLREARRSKDENVALLGRAMVVSAGAYFASGTFLSVLYYPHFWYLLGFVVALDLATKRSTHP